MIRIWSAALGLVAALIISGPYEAGGAELLVNGGFEQGLVGWSANSGDYGRLDLVDSPVHSGGSAALLTGSQLQAHSVSQWVSVQPAQTHRFSAWVLLNDPGVTEVYLDVAWWEAGGSLILVHSSVASLTGTSDQFRFLDTGEIVSPQSARSARVAAIVRTAGAFTVYFDDFALDGASPTSTPQATTPATTPTVTPPPEPTPPPIPSPEPPPLPPARTQAPQQETPPPEPSVFPHLVNGGFEQLRPDGTPYGWRKQGGEMSAPHEPRTEGSRAGALTSRTASTKWLHQTVSVAGGQYYEASADAMAMTNVEAVWLRISWYANEDGSGSAIANIDSSPILSNAGFRSLAIPSVRSPSEARSAKIKLMLRPASEAEATAYFDAVTFTQTLGAVLDALTSPRSASAPAADAAVVQSVEAGVGESDKGAAPGRLANVKPPKSEPAEAPDATGRGRPLWAIAIAIAVPVAALSACGAYELWRRRKPRAL